MNVPRIKPRGDEIYEAVMPPEVPRTVFRVDIMSIPGRVSVDVWGWPGRYSRGTKGLSREQDPSYVFKSVDDLPDWVQKKLAVLSTLNPNVSNEAVPNVGARISKNVFWVYPEDGVEEQTGECFGEHARSVSQASST